MSKRDTRTPEERELAEARRLAEEHDYRMNERMTRGAILEAIGFAIHDCNAGSFEHLILKKLYKAFQ